MESLFYDVALHPLLYNMLDWMLAPIEESGNVLINTNGMR